MTRPRRALLLTDQPLARDVFEHALRGTDFVPHHADDPADIASAVEAIEPDLVVLVLQDPAAGLRELRSLHEGRNIGAIAVVAQPELAAEAEEAGADGTIIGAPEADPLRSAVRMVSKLVTQREQWRASAEEHACLLDVARTLHEQPNPPQALTIAANRLASAVPLSSCSIIVLGPDPSRCFIATGAAAMDPSVWQGAGDLERARYPELDQVFRSGKPLLLDELTYDPFELTISHDEESFDLRDGHTGALFPIGRQGEVHGVMSLHLPGLAQPLSDSKITFLERAAELCARPIAAIREQMATERKFTATLEPTETSLEEHDLLVNLVEHSPNAIVAADMEGSILVFNRSAESLFGYTRDEVVGRLDAASLLLPGAGQELQRILRSSELGEPGYVHNLQTEALAGDGEIVPVSVSAAHLKEADQPVAFVAIFHDLRQRLALESRLQQMSAQLVESEKQATLAVLAGTTAHELNQPLTTIMGLVELLQIRVEEDPGLSKQLDRVYAETERMSAIVKRIGRITRFSTTSYVGETEILDLEKSSE